jgi:hypothetical protein
MSDFSYYGSYDLNATCEDLNLARIPTDAGSCALVDPGVGLTRDVRVYFRSLAAALVSFIEEADAIVGCCAWLTEPNVLDALASRTETSLIVNKEDFLASRLRGQQPRPRSTAQVRPPTRREPPHARSSGGLELRN